MWRRWAWVTLRFPCRRWRRAWRARTTTTRTIRRSILANPYMAYCREVKTRGCVGGGGETSVSVIPWLGLFVCVRGGCVREIPRPIKCSMNFQFTPSSCNPPFASLYPPPCFTHYSFLSLSLSGLSLSLSSPAPGEARPRGAAAAAGHPTEGDGAAAGATAGRAGAARARPGRVPGRGGGPGRGLWWGGRRG